MQGLPLLESQPLYHFSKRLHLHSLGFTTVWEGNFPELCASSWLNAVAIWPIWLSKLWILALTSCWNCFDSCWNCKVLVAKDLTISSKDIPELEVWPGCCLRGYGCLYCWQIGQFWVVGWFTCGFSWLRLGWSLHPGLYVLELGSYFLYGCPGKPPATFTCSMGSSWKVVHISVWCPTTEKNPTSLHRLHITYSHLTNKRS